MANVKLPHFGVLDSDALDEYYDAAVDFNRTQIQIDLNFETKTIDIDRLKIVSHFIENIRIHDLNNQKYIESDFTDEGGNTVKEYLEHHIEELPTDELKLLVGADVKPNDQAKILLKKLYLVRVGLYPDSKDQFAIFDYSLGQELTNYLVVVNGREW